MKRMLPLALAAGTALALAVSAQAQTLVPLLDLGAADPIPGTDDAYQLTVGSGTPDGLNYYFDNGSPPGATFTTGGNSSGYTLTSLAIKTAGGSGGLPSGGQAYYLRIYSVSGANATLAATYMSDSSTFTFTDLDWLQWTNLSLSLLPNSQYAYTFARASSGWEMLGSINGNPYTGGEVALIPPAGGTITFGSSHDYDATFLVGLAPITALAVNPPTISPANSVEVGTTATLNVVAAGPGTLHYQWRTDGGSGGARTNIPGANADTLAVNTTGIAVGAYRYDVVVTNSSSSITSTMVLLGVSAPASSAALVSMATASPGASDITQFVAGGNRDGLNYYTDNGPNNGYWAGQTFTTGTNSQGYYLTSVSFQTGGGGVNGVGTVQAYNLYLYGVDGATAALLAHYTNAAFSFADGDWLKWSGFQFTLRPNSTYAYAFGRSSNGTGWEALAVSPNTADLYTQGQIALIPTSGGTMTFGGTGLSDAVFDIGLLPIGVGPDPKPFAGNISIAPASTVAPGTEVTLSQTASGLAPLYFQWRTDGGSGTLTNIPGATGTNLVLNTTGWTPGPRKFDFVVTNLFGTATASAVTVTVTYTNTAGILEDIGTTDPVAGANDVAQLVNPTGASSPDGMNYYFDNGTPPGQTFTTGSNPNGYTLSSLALRMAGNRGGLPAAGQAYILRLYSIVGANAYLHSTFTSQNNFLFTASDWLRWSDLNVPLAANSTYAYTFARSSSGSGWENLGNVSGNPYTGGEAVLIPPAGGSITSGSSHDFDATFVIGMALAGRPVVGPVKFSPTNVVYAGTPVTLSASVSGTGPFTYQWKTDNGAGGALSNISGASGPTYAFDTTAAAGKSVVFALMVTDGSGQSTVGAASALTVNAASPPIIMTDITPTSLSRFTGGTVKFSAAFDGTMPIFYQWQADKGTGYVNLPGQTNATLTLTDLKLSDAGSYILNVSNSLGTASSSVASLAVWQVPATPFTVNFQWHSTEGGNDVGVYSGTGVAGMGTGTYWNQVIGPSSWTVGTFSSSSGMLDDGSAETGISWTVVNGGSWDWATAPVNPLLNSAASAYDQKSFSFILPNGLYNLVLFSCNGTEATTANGATLFVVNGVSKVATPTQNISFIEGDTYVVFPNVTVTDTTLNGTWSNTNGKTYGSLNGAQLRYLGPAVPLTIKSLANGQVQLQWSQGTLLEAPSVNGPWTTNVATSPYSLTPSGAQKLYRVIVQ